LPRPIPTRVAHFTHLDNLARIAVGGLRCDNAAWDGPSITEVGEPSIKARRRQRRVRVEPGGVVADYVPFYFAARSPMLYLINAGGVSSFSGDSHDIVYLMSTIEQLQAAGLSLVFTDRNAVLELAQHSAQVEDLDTLVDWKLMGATYWANTDDDPDRKERRMAECLAHRAVPWSAFARIAVFDEARRIRVRQILDSVAIDSPPIDVRPEFYF
jgi:hypothetical protein